MFSPVDDVGEAEIKAYLDRRAPDSAPLALVVGPDGCRCRQLCATIEVPVWEVGETVRLVSDAGAASAASVHDRQIRAFGAVGQAILARLHVAVIGGGTGSVIVQQLAHLGVRTLDPPPLKWSALEYGFRATEDGRYGEAAQAGGDHHQAASG